MRSFSKALNEVNYKALCYRWTERPEIKLVFSHGRAEFANMLSALIL